MLLAEPRATRPRSRPVSALLSGCTFLLLGPHHWLPLPRSLPHVAEGPRLGKCLGLAKLRNKTVDLKISTAGNTGKPGGRGRLPPPGFGGLPHSPITSATCCHTGSCVGNSCHRVPQLPIGRFVSRYRELPRQFNTPICGGNKQNEASCDGPRGDIVGGEAFFVHAHVVVVMW